MKKMTPSQRRKRQRHEFLLTFFDPKPEYQEKQVNGWWLVKYHNGNSDVWEVAVYSPESFNKADKYKRKRREAYQIVFGDIPRTGGQP